MKRKLKVYSSDSFDIDSDVSISSYKFYTDLSEYEYELQNVVNEFNKQSDYLQIVIKGAMGRYVTDKDVLTDEDYGDVSKYMSNLKSIIDEIHSLSYSIEHQAQLLADYSGRISTRYR